MKSGVSLTDAGASPIICLSGGALGARVGERLGNHFVIRTFIDADFLAAGAENFMVYGRRRREDFFYARLMAAQHLTGPDFVIFPELCFACGATDNQQCFFLFLLSAG